MLLRLLRELEPNRHFVKLWLSQALSLTAFNMVNFTLLIRVFELTGSTTAVSLFILSFGIPSLLFGAVAGVFADRWDRRKVLIFTNLIRTALVLVYLVNLDSLAAIYGTTFLIATVTQFFTPAEGAMIPELVERKRLVAANATFMVTMFLSFVAGYGLAGPLAATGGDELPIVVAFVMFALATLACLTVPKVRLKTHRMPVRDAYRSVGEHFKEGFQLIRKNLPVRYGLVQLTFMWATIGVILTIVPAFTAQVLGIELREVSRLIILPIGVGMLGGGYLLHRARKQFGIRVIVAASLLLAGAAIAVLGQLPDVVRELTGQDVNQASNTAQLITSVASTLIGLSLAVIMIASQTLIHEYTEARLRGRIFGVLGMSVNAANTIPVLVAGLFADQVGVGAVVTVVGIGLIVWGIASFVLSRKKPVDT